MKKIYTKTGDKGTTGTLLGRMSKSDQLAHTLGTVDELNSWIGLCRSEIPKQLAVIDKILRDIQNNLLIIGATLAGSKGVKLTPGETTKLERLIDNLTADLPKLDNFIYPTGVLPSTHLHITRTVSRRLEREVVALESVDKHVLTYLNRLSDALFTLARWVNLKLGGEEEVWRK
jgi:cob(I)alamin adenosyltransferase